MAASRHGAARPGFTGPQDKTLRRRVEKLLRDNPDGILPIVLAGDPVLREPTREYNGELGALFGTLLEAMRRTMLDAPGVGLAANQIGLPIAVAVLWNPPATSPDDPMERTALPHRTIVNPRYEHVVAPDADGLETRTFYEGCLSVPGYQAEVERFRAVRLIAQDEAGAPIDEVLTGWPARIVQHETDHLGGGLYIDKADLRTLAAVE